MILLGESGSTKTEWCLITEDEIVHHAVTDGINPFFQTRKEISRCIRLQLPEGFFKKKANNVYFYGAGCSSEKMKNVVKASSETQFRTPTVVESDLFGVARALFHDEAGIACILGTGSNSCFYNGDRIVQNVKSLGYILGDEGSGAVLGKLFLADCLKNLAPSELRDAFYEKYKIEPDKILDYVYTKPLPNKLLAVLSLFLPENIDHPYVFELVKTSLQSFFDRNILQYDYQNYPVRLVGSVAQQYSDIIFDIAKDYNIKIDVIKESPIEGLVEFHQKKLKEESLNN